jgi:hypothetical protein
MQFKFPVQKIQYLGLKPVEILPLLMALGVSGIN